MSIASEPSDQLESEQAVYVHGLIGALRCASCGYEIASYRSLPSCPMCREMTWERAPWRPFTRLRI